MKNLKRILAIATSMTMAIAMVAGVTPMTVKAIDNQNEQQQAMEYYGFQRITDFSNVEVNQILYFTTTELNAGDVRTDLPENTAVLKVIEKNNNMTAMQVNYYKGHLPAETAGVAVETVQRADGFDTCPGGFLWFDNGQITFACSGGYVGGTVPALDRVGDVCYNVYKCNERPVGSGGDGYTPDPAPYIPPHEHTYEWVELVDMDGYFLGQEQYKCTGCGHVRESRTLNYTCPVIDETLDEVAKVESEIAANPTGANRTITKDVGGYYFINRPLAEAFTQNGTITLIYTFLYEHKLYKLTIPAGFDLTAVLNEEGYAGFMWIAAHPGTTLEELGEYYY